MRRTRSPRTVWTTTNTAPQGIHSHGDKALLAFRVWVVDGHGERISKRLFCVRELTGACEDLTVPLPDQTRCPRINYAYTMHIVKPGSFVRFLGRSRQTPPTVLGQVRVWLTRGAAPGRERQYRLRSRTPLRHERATLVVADPAADPGEGTSEMFNRRWAWRSPPLRRTPLDLYSVPIRHEYSEAVSVIRAVRMKSALNCLKASPARCPKSGRCRLGCTVFFQTGVREDRRRRDLKCGRAASRRSCSQTYMAAAMMPTPTRPQKPTNPRRT